MNTALIRIAFCALAAFAASGAVAAEAQAPQSADRKQVPMSKLTPAERRARRAAKLAADGGSLERPIKGRVIRIKVDTDKFALSDLEKAAADIRRYLRLAVEVTGRTDSPTNAIGAFVLVAEKGADSPMLLCAPEENWSTVNVTRILEDNPDAETAKTRLRKEVWRALAYALGVGNATKPPCLMRPIRRASDLDKEAVEMVSPPPMMSIMYTAQKLDVARYGMTTYRKACQEGWAHSPTNEVQKKIWAEVHEVPSAPLKLTK